MPASSCVGYVLSRLGAPSETFIYEEMVSLLDAGLQPVIFHGGHCTATVEHATLRRVQAQMACAPMAEHGRLAQLSALLAWLRVAPLRSLRVLAQALRSPHRWIYLATLQPAWQARRLGCRRLHAHFADANALHAMAMAAWSGLPYSLTLHRYDLFEPVLDDASLREVMQTAQPLITISEFNRRHLAERYGIGEVALVHCGVDLARFSHQFHAREPDAPARLLTVGRLVPEKAYDQLIAAMAQLKAAGQALQLQIAGAGPQEAALRAQVERLGLQAEVLFLGPCSSEQVIALHRQAHVFVSSSRVEGLPVVCIEAMALGTPVVATAVYGVPELVEHERSGLLVAAESADALAQAVARCLQDEALRQRLSRGGRQRVEQDFERGRCTQALLAHWRWPAQNRCAHA